MALELAKNLLRMFYNAPTVNGLLVFDNNQYYGVLLKRDIERCIIEGHFDLNENINLVKTKALEDLIIYNSTGKVHRIPTIDTEGRLLRILSYEEFQSQFDYELYDKSGLISDSLDHLDHAYIITNYFKKILYANRKALELFQIDLLGKNLSALLRNYDVRMMDKRMVFIHQDFVYTLWISSSEPKNFYYYNYQIVSSFQD